jgi:hypothetical protein
VSTNGGSRHEDLPSYEAVLTPGAPPVVLFEPRPIPAPPPSVVHTVAAADRLDLLAERYLGDPFEFWRIADANPALAPEDILDPGARIAIPARP